MPCVFLWTWQLVNQELMAMHCHDDSNELWLQLQNKSIHHCWCWSMVIIEVIQCHFCGYIPILLWISFNGLFWMGNLLPIKSLLPQCNSISLKNYTTINTTITPLQLPQKPPCVVLTVFAFIIVILNICCIVVAIVGTVIAAVIATASNQWLSLVSLSLSFLLLFLLFCCHYL